MPYNANMNINDFCISIEHSFQNIFEMQNGRDDLKKLLYLIKNNQPIRTFLDEQPSGDMSTIFTPFHGGMVFPHNIVELKKTDILSENFIKFCSISAVIADMLEEWERANNEPDQREKKIMKKYLEEFLIMLPTYDIFKTWCSG